MPGGPTTPTTAPWPSTARSNKPSTAEMWGRQLATSMLADAGFGDVQVREVESDPLNYYYVARK